MTDLVKLTIDNKQVEVPKGTTILQACEQVDVQVPRFCYHSRLSIAGNCRMCLVELDGAPKPVASCAFPVAEGQVVRTQSQIAKDARKSVMEFLLANHPLDCPLCDQGGECDLQDFSMRCGSDKGDFTLEKRTVNNPDLGPYIETFMNRCIHCMRCVRFSDEIAGKNEIGGLFRGGDKVITNNENGPVTSNLSGNMIDLCPVGALTSKPAKYTYRSWELAKNETIDVLDSILPSIYADTNNNKVVRIRARENEAINQEWISDMTRFSYDGLYNNRIEATKFKNKTVTWEKAFNEILEVLHESNPKKIAGLVGDNLAIEDLYSFKQFFNKTVGSNNIDYRLNGFALSSFNKSNITFESSIADVDNADMVLFVNTDLEKDSPVLNSRIYQTQQKNKTKVFAIGKECKNSNLKINQLTDNIDNLIKDIDLAAKELKTAKNAVVFVDVESILVRQDADKIVSKLHSLNAKINYYTPNSGFINAVDILKTDTAMPTNKLLENLHNNKVETLFVYGNVKIDENLARNAKKLVYIGTHNNKIADIADIVLPTVTNTEKNSQWNNVEGKVLESKAITMPFKDSRVDWKVFRALSEYVGEKLAFDTLTELREELAKEYNLTSKEDLVTDFSIIEDKYKLAENNKEINIISLNSRYYK